MARYFVKYPNGQLGKARRLRREMTDAEWKLWSLLRKNNLGVHFRRQVPFGPYILDFLAIKVRLVVELDGSQHCTRKALQHDSRRDEYLNSKGLTVMRFSVGEFIRNPRGVVEILYEEVQKRAAKRLPLP
jgi:very-short-patch-repair endonuclease